VAQHVSGVPRPSSGEYNCTRSLCFYRRREAVGALLIVVCQTTTNNAPTAGCTEEEEEEEEEVKNVVTSKGIQVGIECK
jgi:hypothetical protein